MFLSPSRVKYLLLCVLALFFVQTQAHTPCTPEAAEYGFVCVCTDDHCDDMPDAPVFNTATDLFLYESKLGSSADSTYFFKRTALSMNNVTTTTTTTTTTTDHENKHRETLHQEGMYHITIDVTVGHQSIIGFGGAFTDAVAIDNSYMSATCQQHILDSYYGTAGIGYTLGRVPIASCDFSTSHYTYDDVVDDFDLEHFSIEMDLDLKIPFIKAALNTAKTESGVELKLFSSPWSGPAWLKNNNSTYHNGHLIGPAGNKYHKTWAMYFSKFFTEYQKQGIEFWATTIQNEPNGNTGTFQEMVFNASAEAAFLKTDLGPLLAQEWPDLKIIMLDDQRSHLPVWADTMLSDPDAAQYVDGIGVHWYAALEDTINYFDRLYETHVAYPDTFILATEACEGYLPSSAGPHLGSWKRGETYGHDILQDLNNYAVGWTDWNILLDLQGGPNWANNFVDSPIIVDTDNTATFYKQPMFYYMAHFSKFLVPDSTRVHHSNDGPKALEVATFLTPTDEVVVIVLNRDNFKTLSYTIEDKQLGLSYTSKVAPHSIQTYVYQGGAAAAATAAGGGKQ